MHASTLLYGLVFLQGAMTSPVAEPVQGPEVEPRAVERRTPTSGDIPFPRFPSRKPKGHQGSDCSTGGGSVSQSNLCSAGNPYCCTSDGKGGNVCSNSSTCEQTVICCNNNNGYQICIGDIDFNMPITINIYE
ncbi:hypothetical protein CEP52_016786 [Fusarium oligoseptatum]|uniref:Hydrophobin n=2 Tax=Fusarium solani species complex TaxID=232080 RepID=A0A428S025_9HYPO|nr:hypothetical protein CEP52_016786 [Fusarium oligoseptatum]RSM04736.1 hypothetical protein CDV31_009903 [Fusarium ambrosium]